MYCMRTNFFCFLSVATKTVDGESEAVHRQELAKILKKTEREQKKAKEEQRKEFIRKIF